MYDPSSLQRPTAVGSQRHDERGGTACPGGAAASGGIRNKARRGELRSPPTASGTSFTTLHRASACWIRTRAGAGQTLRTFCSRRSMNGPAPRWRRSSSSARERLLFPRRLDVAAVRSRENCIWAALVHSPHAASTCTIRGTPARSRSAGRGNASCGDGRVKSHKTCRHRSSGITVIAGPASRGLPHLAGVRISGASTAAAR